MKPFVLSALVVLTISAGATPLSSLAQTYPTPSMNEGDLAFACAMAAHIDGGATVDSSETTRLAQYGYEQHTAGVAELLAIPGMDQAGWHELFPEAPADFWVGQEWSKAVTSINRMVEIQAPYTGQPNAEWQASRAKVGGEYYLSQKCGDVGFSQGRDSTGNSR